MYPSHPNHTIDELLVSYLLGEATAEQEQLAREWINSSPENQRYFSEFKTIWEKSRELAASSTVDVDAAWERMKGKLEAGRNGGKEERKKGGREEGKLVGMTSGWKRVAAILVLILTGALSWMIYRQWTNAGWMELASLDEPVKKTLSDSSRITLNKGAILEYPKQFATSKRLVKLKGEAFFEVTKNPEQPFEVAVNQLTVRVLGTSFNIRESDSATIIIVETGKVRISDQHNQIDLLAGEQITIRKTDNNWSKSKQPDKLYQYYRTRSFSCDSTPLWKLVEVLNEAYDVKISIINPSIRDLPITTVFENQPLDEVLSIIQQTLDITITRKDDLIYVE